MDVVAEFTIEPFVEGTPGAHVLAGLDAVREAGLEPAIGPFGSSIEGDIGAVTAAVARLLEAAPRPAPPGSRCRSPDRPGPSSPDA